nr:hypothetical protein [Tanacetum cinerariifolium]
MIIHESNSIYESTNKVDELRVLPGHVLRAARVLISKDDLNVLKLIREEDEAVETLDPQFLLGSKLLEIVDSTFLDLLLEPILVISLSFPDVLLLDVVFLTTFVECGYLGGTTVVEVILVKGNIFLSIVKIRPV